MANKPNFKICWKDYADFCDQIIQEINTVRHTPNAFAPDLQKYIDEFDDGCYYVQHSTQDGKGTEECGIVLEEDKKVVSVMLSYFSLQIIASFFYSSN